MLLPSRASVTAIVAVAVAAIAAGSFARLTAHQAAPPGERPLGLVVDFGAVQADGTPAPDLQPSEVEVRINDRVRVVRSVRRISTAPAPAAAGAAVRLTAPYGSNDSVASGRRFVLLVDEESFSAGAGQMVRRAVEGLLPHLTPADQTMVVALPFGGVKVPFTSRPARIRLGIERLAGQGARTETGSDLACRTRRFLESVDQFLLEQPRRGSPVTLVLFTAGLAAPRRDAPIGLAPGMCELLVGQFRRVAAAASAARANLYILQPADIGMQASAWRESIGGAGDRGSDNPLEGIEHLAGVTGAARLPLDAAGAGSLLRVARESSAFYEAEIEPERNEVLGRSRPMSIRVSRRGITVRARPEISFADSVARMGTARLTVNDVLASTDSFPDLRLRVGGFTVREGEGRVRVGVLVEPVDPQATLQSVGAILIADDGSVVGRWFGRDATERPLLGAIGAPPGNYRLRVAAIDGAGRTGAAEEEVAAVLTPVGPLTLASLMFGVSRPEGMRPQLAFGSEPTAIASFDIYGGESGMALSAALEVARDADGPAILSLPLALKRSNDARVLATGAVPIGALPPGDYVVRAVIKLQDGTTGRVMRTLRKGAA